MSDAFRSKAGLIARSDAPYNAEPPLDRLRARLVTATPDFYVRCHGPVPHLAKAQFRLPVDGLVGTPLMLTMAELRTRFVPRTVTAVMQCAGNRRSGLAEVRPVTGTAWSAGAIGNAVWTGAALADVLRDARAADGAGLHVAFAAADEYEAEGKRVRYGVSIPMAKAMSPEVLLAYAMGGEALTPEHGFPLRVVVPGYAGVRSPKWLQRITVQERPSGLHPQASDYKLFPPHVTAATANPGQGITIDEMPLTAAICEPAAFAVLAPGPVALRGYAVAGLRGVARVDVSVDGGRTWRQAVLEHDPAARWSWTFWQHTAELPKGEHEIAVRAWDTAGQTQPSTPDEVWNFKGYLNASWHRVCVRVG